MSPAERRAPATSIDALIDEIDCGVKLIGIDHVGLGSDFEGDPNLVAGLQPAVMRTWTSARSWVTT
jgi:membrane dipeptidase